MTYPELETLIGGWFHRALRRRCAPTEALATVALRARSAVSFLGGAVGGQDVTEGTAGAGVGVDSHSFASDDRATRANVALSRADAVVAERSRDTGPGAEACLADEGQRNADVSRGTDGAREAATVSARLTNRACGHADGPRPAVEGIVAVAQRDHRV